MNYQIKRNKSIPPRWDVVNDKGFILVSGLMSKENAQKIVDKLKKQKKLESN